MQPIVNRENVCFNIPWKQKKNTLGLTNAHFWIKQLFWKVLENSQENIHSRESFYTLQAYNFS